MVLLEASLDRAADTPGITLGPGPTGRNPGVDEALGFRGYPCLSEMFLSGWLGNGLPELSEQAVNLV